MAVGDIVTRTVTDTINGDSTDTTVIAATTDFEIVAVNRLPFSSVNVEEVSLHSVVVAADGESATVTWKCKGKSGVTYPVSLNVVEVDNVA